MKYRDSGMPDEAMWKTFFDPSMILRSMEVDSSVHQYLDIGCGYGTFLFPASDIVKKATGYDIDEQMIQHCLKLKHTYQKSNIELVLGDMSDIHDKFLIANQNNFDYIALFNILHCEEPVQLFNFAKNLLTDNGKIGIIHWQYRETPRGPSMEIRPRPEQIIHWAETAALKLKKSITLPPYHFGMIFKK